MRAMLAERARRDATPHSHGSKNRNGWRLKFLSISKKLNKVKTLLLYLVVEYPVDSLEFDEYEYSGKKYLSRGLVSVRGQAVHPKREVGAARLDGSRPLGHSPAQLSPAFLVRVRVRVRVSISGLGFGRALASHPPY